MIVVGENLRGLINSKNICEDTLFDEFSIKLNLDKNIYRLIAPNNIPLIYGKDDVSSYYHLDSTINHEIIIKPNECILACSSDEINMPLGYLGFVQTKGTLARLFVSAHCSDSQIEPGFSGKITLELTNHSPFSISLPVGVNIAQIYILRCSTNNSKPYNGKYKSSDLPTLPLAF